MSARSACSSGIAARTSTRIVELETSKAVVEVRAGQAGIIRRIFCQDGEWQNIGGVLALVSDAANEPLAESAEVPGGAAPMLADFEVV